MVSESTARTEPQIVAVAQDRANARIELHIPENLRYFEGHFPGCPILPGVVQLNWAIRFGQQHFVLPPRFTHLANIKFMRVIVPGKNVVLALRHAPERNELAFEYRIGEAVCSSGVIGFAQ